MEARSGRLDKGKKIIQDKERAKRIQSKEA